MAPSRACTTMLGYHSVVLVAFKFKPAVNRPQSHASGINIALCMC